MEEHRELKIDTAKKMLVAAYCALRSYQLGNPSPELAKGIADTIEFLIPEEINSVGKIIEENEDVEK